MSETKEEWMQRMLDALGVDPEDIMEVCEMFFDDVQEQLDSIKNADADGNIEVVARSAHAIKGSSANLGFESISELAKALELEAKAGSVNDLPKQLEGIISTIANRKEFVGL